MHRSDFWYELRQGLIAQHPADSRSGSRLLTLDGDSGNITDLRFTDLPILLHAGDLLVFNDTRVIPARIFGRKETGGSVELLIERILDQKRVLAQLRASKTPKTGTWLHLEGGVSVCVGDRQGDFFEIAFESTEPVSDILERIGHVPLPPYIRRAGTRQCRGRKDAGSDRRAGTRQCRGRKDAGSEEREAGVEGRRAQEDKQERMDRERYQTIYARRPGAVAAPTAGLHFDEALFQRLREFGVETAFLTLHVGAATFQPVRVDVVEEHRMHSEHIEVPAEVCRRAQRAREEERRVIAVGSTVVRALETAAAYGDIRPYAGETDIFIYPGYRFRVVDAMVTNFHLPESTLLMLVCAFAGKENVLRAYRHAVQNMYRFFSYGDAMFLTPKVASGK